MKQFNFLLIIFLMGVCLVTNGLFVLIGVFISLYYQDGITTSLFQTSILLISFGVFIMVLSKNHNKEIKKNEGYLVVSMGWLFLCLSGVLPYILSGVIPQFSDALFESVSGYTTTGSSVITDIENLPQSLLYWRAMTNWVGGMGIIVLTVAILPILGVGGIQLFSAESPGISTDKIHPRITDTAKRLWFIYVGMTILESILLSLSGMSFFDAICHSMSTVATGGFSTKNNSIAYWNDNPSVQYIMIFFMMVSGANLVLIYYGIKLKFRKITKDEEFKFYLVSIIIATIVTVISIYKLNISIEGIDTAQNTMEYTIRTALFQVVTVITCCGFVSGDYTAWGPFLKIFFLGLMFLGGCSGSTAGGIKVQRHLLLLKNGWFDLKRIIHPNAVIPIRLNGKTISRRYIYNVMTFFIFYMLCLVIGSIVLGFIGLDFETSIGAAVSCLGNIGPAFGDFNPIENFSKLSDSGKYWCSFLMLLGRLEIITILILFNPDYWKS